MFKKSVESKWGLTSIASIMSHFRHAPWMLLRGVGKDHIDADGLLELLLDVVEYVGELRARHAGDEGGARQQTDHAPSHGTADWMALGRRRDHKLLQQLVALQQGPVDHTLHVCKLAV